MKYSQNNEEDIILDFFPQPYVGVFLDIGAHDGINLSNTRALFERGWGGVLVEPSPMHFLKLWELYGGNNRIKLVNAAVDSCNRGLVELKYNYEWPAYSSTLSQEKAIEFRANDYSKSFLVPACGISELEELGPFDFVSIDVEGMEIPILGNASKVIEPARLICVEFCPKTESTIRTQIESYGFKIIHQTPENLLASKPSPNESRRNYGHSYW